MMAVLRHRYGLHYALDMPHWHDGITLLPHVKVYTTAGGYQATSAQTEASGNIRDILDSNSMTGSPILELTDLLGAIREIITGTTSSDRDARRILVMHCVNHLHILRKEEAFMALLRDIAELGAEIIDLQKFAAMDFTLTTLERDVDDAEMDQDYFPGEVDDSDSEGGVWACEKCETTVSMPVLCSSCDGAHAL